jgi:hypothetical protein
MREKIYQYSAGEWIFSYYFLLFWIGFVIYPLNIMLVSNTNTYIYINI